MAKGSYKAQMNTFGGNTPFALQGLLGKQGSNQINTIAQSPIGLSNSSSLPTYQPTRGIHTSRVLSGPVANRPLSPHLPIKKPQFSAAFSISHRIFGVALGTVIMAVPLAVKFSHQFDI